MREKRNEQRIIQYAVLRTCPRITIIEIEQLRNREKRNAERQHDLRHREARTKVIKYLDEKAEILEIPQKPQIEKKTRSKSRPFPATPSGITCPQHRTCQKIISCDTHKQKRQIPHIPITVKEQTQQKEPAVRRPHAGEPPAGEIPQQRQRQECQQERIRIKQHPLRHTPSKARRWTRGS